MPPDAAPREPEPPVPKPPEDPPPTAPAPDPAPVPEVPEMRPGVDAGAPDAQAWLASQANAEHRGLPSRVEQPALTQAPGLPTPPSVPSPAAAPAPMVSPAQAAESTAEPAATPAAADARAIEQRTPAVPPPAPEPTEVRPPPEAVTSEATPSQIASVPPPPAPGSAPREAEVGPDLAEDGEPEPALPRAAEPAPDPKELEDGPLMQGPPRPTVPDEPTRRDVPESERPDVEPTAESQKTETAVAPATGEGLPPEALSEAAPSPAPVKTAEPPRERDGEAEAVVEPETPLTPVPKSEEASQAEPSTSALASAPSAPSTPSTPSPGGTTPGDRPFERSDRDVDPTSVAGVGEIRFGRVLARDGLEVMPARPRFSHTVRLTALPRNPVIRVTFNRAGRVTRAEFVRGRSTGYPEVDGPLLTAMYRWTARGSKLRDIGPAGVTMTFKVLLREERDLGAPKEGDEDDSAAPDTPSSPEEPAEPDFAEPKP